MSNKSLKELYYQRDDTYKNYYPKNPEDFRKKIDEIETKIVKKNNGKRLLSLLKNVSNLRAELHLSRTLTVHDKTILMSKIIKNVNEIEYLLEIAQDSLLDYDELFKKKVEQLTENLSKSLSILTQPQSISKTRRRLGFGIKNNKKSKKKKPKKKK